ncbi:hypothetical protein GOODEAATRI_021166, partial [Goodea atripinnis]
GLGVVLFRVSVFLEYQMDVDLWKLFCELYSFLDNLESRSKGYASPGPANGQSPSSGSQSPIVPPSGASTGSSSPSTPQPSVPSQMLPQSPSVSASSPAAPTAVVSGATSPTAEMKPLPQSPEHQQSSAAPGGSGPQKRSFMSRWFGSYPATEAPTSAPGEFNQTMTQAKSTRSGV